MTEGKKRIQSRSVEKCITKYFFEQQKKLCLFLDTLEYQGAQFWSYLFKQSQSTYKGTYMKSRINANLQKRITKLCIFYALPIFLAYRA